MIRKIAACLLCLLVFGICCSQRKKAPSIRFPYRWLGQQGFGGNIDRLNLPEPSGICFHPGRKTLFVVSDEGFLAEIQKDGTPVFSKSIPGDLEGITVNPNTGFLYIVKEGDDVILEYDPDQQDVLRTFPINREFQGDPNFLQKQSQGHDNGVECIAFVPNPEHPEGGTFYVGNQWDPPLILEIEVPLISCGGKSGPARIIRQLPFVLDDPSAMYYDSRRGILNVVSDADNILVELTLDGRLVQEYAFLADNQEGLAVDDEGYLYIAQDSGGILKVLDLRY